MQVFAIPVEDKLIIYRPLRRLAFVGNQAMAGLATRLAAGDPAQDAPADARAFLDAVGFLQPDPPRPAPPDLTYCPTTAVLLVTNRCNLRCTYCYAAAGSAPAEDLALASARAAIDYVHANARTLGRPRFELTFHGGGEPLQAWTVMQAAVAYARGKDLPCEITMVSNGVWNARQLDWILEHFDALTISCDGRPETQDRQRPFVAGGGSARAVLHTVAALDRAGFKYGMRLTATAPWREQLPKDVRFLCEHTGCQSMQAEPAFNTQRGEHQGPTRAESDAFVDAFMDAYEIASRTKRNLTYSGARPWLLTQSFCTAPYNALIVNANDDLVACYEVAGSRHPLARRSVYGRVTGGTIAVDAQARASLTDYLEGRRAHCQECFCHWHCAGDCYTRSYFAAAGGAPGASARCHINREITARLLLWQILSAGGVWHGQDAPAQEMMLLRAF